MTRSASLLCALALAACGGATVEPEPTVERSPEPTVERSPEPAVEPEPTIEPEPDAPPVAEPELPPPFDGSLESLLRYEWEERTYDSRPMPAPDEAVAGCAPWQGTGAPDFEWYEGCDLRETLARGRRGWQALQIDWEEGGPGQVHLVVGDARRRRERIGGDVTPARVEAIRAALGAPGIQPARDRVGRGIPVEFSLGSYHPLVELEGTGWLLWLETVDDLDAPEWVAWLVSPDGRTRHQLARRPADLGPCDGGGYWCEATGAECDAAGLRAEGRLCVLPLGVRRVAIHERSLALLGSVMVAGHGGMPGLTWFLRAPLAPDTTPPPNP